ncbi:MAG: hypothetical protein V3R85_06575 [Alphaproteobacteria bacterium]
MITRLLVLLLAVTLGASLASCGKKGELDPPPGKTSDFPRQYPR